MVVDRVHFYHTKGGVVRVERDGEIIHTIRPMNNGQWQLFDLDDKKRGFAYPSITEVMDRFNRPNIS